MNIIYDLNYPQCKTCINYHSIYSHYRYGRCRILTAANIYRKRVIEFNSDGSLTLESDHTLARFCKSYYAYLVENSDRIACPCYGDKSLYEVFK